MFRSPAASRARLSYRSPVGRTAAAERCPAHARRSRSTRPELLDIAENPPRGGRLAPLRACPRRPCFPPPPTRAGRGSRTSSGPQSLSLSGGAHLMHQLLPWGKLVWLFSNSCLHRMHVFVAPSIGCVSSVVVVCAALLHPTRKNACESRRESSVESASQIPRSRQISEPPDSRTRIAELALERWRARRGSR